MQDTTAGSGPRLEVQPNGPYLVHGRAPLTRRDASRKEIGFRDSVTGP